MNPQGSAYLLPFAGGSSLAYRFLAAQAPAEVHLFPIELPGHGHRMGEPLISDLDPLVADATAQIAAQLRRRGDEPYCLFGHSMGGLMAWRIACALRAASFPAPQALIVSGMRGPRLLRPTGRGDLPTPELRAELQRLGGSAPALLEDPEMFACFEPVLRADFRALDSFCYRAEPPLDIPVTVLLGTEDRVTLDMAQAWQHETTLPLSIHPYSGGHFFIHQHARALVDLLQRSLSR